MTTTTLGSVMTNLVECHAEVRATADDITKALADAQAKLEEMWLGLCQVADAHFELLAEAREAFRPVTVSRTDADVTDSVKAIMGDITGYTGVTDAVAALEGMLQSYTDQLERWWDDKSQNGGREPSHVIHLERPEEAPFYNPDDGS